MLKTYLIGAATTFIASKYICEEETERALAIAAAWPLLVFAVIVQHIALGAMLGAEVGVRKWKDSAVGFPTEIGATSHYQKQTTISGLVTHDLKNVPLI